MKESTLAENNPELFFIRFSDPEPVLSSSINLYEGVFQHPWLPFYKPAIDPIGLFKMTKANPYHGACLNFQKNMLSKWFTPVINPNTKKPFLSWSDLEKMAFDNRIYGQYYAQRFFDRFGNLTRLAHIPAINMRKSTKPDVYCKLNNVSPIGIYNPSEYFIEFQPGEIIAPFEYDGLQTIYGCPEYIGGIQSALLNEASTLYRRKVFEKNGQHIGYVLVTTDANIDEATAKKIKAEITNTSGPANMYINIPRSSNNRQPVQVVPLGNIESKDEYLNIQNITERQILAMHRMPPIMLGIMPPQGSSLGNIKEIKEYYHEFEVESMQKSFLSLNESEGIELVKFDTPSWRLTQVS